MKSENKLRTPVATAERNKIDRTVLVWLNEFPGLPVATVTTEPQLPIDLEGMALSAITNAYVNRQYIYGGYQAEYTFKIIYRIKPGKSVNARLEALELLNAMGDWCRQNRPNLGEGIFVQSVAPTAQAELYAPYENGDEDYFITIKITYEVI